MQKRQPTVLSKQALEQAAAGVGAAAKLAQTAVAGSGIHVSRGVVPAVPPTRPQQSPELCRAHPTAALQAVHSAAHGLIAQEHHFDSLGQTINSLQASAQQLATSRAAIAAQAEQLPAATQEAQQAAETARALLRELQPGTLTAAQGS